MGGQALVDRIRKFEACLLDWDQEPAAEEQQEWLEQVVGEVIPKFLKNLRILEAFERLSCACYRDHASIECQRS